MTTEPDHRGARVVFVVLGAPLAVLLIVIGAFAITGTLARQSESTTVALAQAIDRVEVRVTHGSVTLRGSEATGVTGERVLTRGLQNPAVSERIVGRSLVIEATCFPLGNTWCDVSYVLDVPSSVSVTVETAVGSIRMSGVDGAADLRSATGTVTAEDATGPLRLESGAGSVRGSGLSSPSVHAFAGAGSVDLAFVAPPDRVEAQAGAGSVDVELPRDGTAYRIEEVPGGGENLRVAVTTDPASSHVLRLESGAGSVSVHEPEA